MVFFIYPNRDASIYEDMPYVNTGLDSVLDVGKTLISSGSTPTTASVFARRSILGFDLNQINDILGSVYYSTSSNGTQSLNLLDSAKLADSGTVKYNLQLSICQTYQLFTTYSLYVNILSGSWDMGIGKLDYLPQDTEGVSWKYKGGISQGNTWQTASFSGNGTGSYFNISGGGNWYTSSVAYQTFSYQDSMDTNINLNSLATDLFVNRINDSIIVRLPEDQERSTKYSGNIQFFSIDTHTIYPPKIKIGIRDFYFNSGSAISASRTQISDGNNVLYIPNIKDTYYSNDKVKFRIECRSKYPPKTFSTSSNLEYPKYYLPSGSLYAIKDFQSEEMIIDYDSHCTTINLDSSGSYFDMWMSCLQPERYYRLLVLVNYGSTKKIFDNYVFKVAR